MSDDNRYSGFRSSNKDARQHRGSLRQALADLDPVLQQIVVRKFFEHRSTAEIAMLLDYSETHVQTMQFHALAQLQRLVTSNKA